MQDGFLVPDPEDQASDSDEDQEEEVVKFEKVSLPD